MRRYTLRLSVRQEKRIARHTGGTRTAGSGNQPGNKGDVRTGNGRWLVEAKTTVTGAYRITLPTWRKIELEALRKLKEPALVVELAGRQLAIIDYEAWLALISAGE